MRNPLRMHALLTDLRFAARMFAKNPGTTTAAVLSLAIAIGPNCALFSVVDRMLFRPSQVEGASSMYGLSIRTETGRESPLYRDLPEYRSAAKGLADLITSPDNRGAMLRREGRSELTFIAFVDENYFSVLGARPAAGRLLKESDERFEGQAPVVVSYSLWQNKFGGRPEIPGQTVLLDGIAFTVVGVAPRSFRGPRIDLIPPDIWLPISAEGVWSPASRAMMEKPDYRRSVTVRLRDGVDKAGAEAAFGAIATRLAREHSKPDKGISAHLEPVSDRGLAILGTLALSLVSLVLFVACANLAGVFLAQGEARRREFAVRLALGAGRARLVRQLLAESLLLALAGGSAGLLLSMWLMAALPAALPAMPFFTITVETGVDGHLLAYTLMLSLITAVAAGLAPAFRASRPDLVPALKGEAPARRSRLRLRGALVIAQVAVCQFLLTGAALLTRSYFEVQKINPGFDASRKLLIASLLPSDRSVRADFGQIAERLTATPGVRRVTYAKSLPMSGVGDGARQEVSVPGVTPVQVGFNVVGPGYFEITGARLLRGRDFQKNDAPGAAMVNETLARQIWGSPDAALGKYFRANSRDCQVAGVVENGKYNSIYERPAPYLFLHAARVGEGSLLIETAGDPAGASPDVRKALAAAAPDYTLMGLMTMRQQMRLAMWAPLAGAVAVGAIAALGIFLAAVGLFGLVSHSVNRRVHEIGVRMALGARAGDVVRLVLRQSLVLVAIGSVTGLAAALAAARVFSSALYQVSPADPLAVLAGTAALLLATLAAAHLPARRATRIDPIDALRNE